MVINQYAVKAYLEREYSVVNRKIQHAYLSLRIDDNFIDFYETGTIYINGPKKLELEQKIEAFKNNWNAPKVFLVFAHGNGGVYCEKVAQTVEKLGLQPIVMKDEANYSRTVTEKLKETFMECQYTIVIATQDEKVQADEAIYRARPNIMLELGIAIGRGWATDKKANVLLFNEDDVIKNVSDISGFAWESAESIQDDSTLHEILYREFKVAGLYNF